MKKLNISSALALPHDAVTSTIVIYGGKGMGKRLALDTPLPTPTGWTTMGDVAVGDELFDEEGRICRVTTVSEVVLGDSYRVSFSDGSSIVADAEHLWSTQDYRARKRGESAQVRTTEEIRRTLLVQHGPQEARNHSIRTALPLCTPALALPVDPYVLGLWLGDGSSAAATITAGDCDVEEVAGFVRAAGCVVSMHRRDPARAPHFGMPGLKVELRDLGVLHDKHVPAAYLRAAPEQRLALLQGLLDSDGGVDGSVVRFDNKNLRLADAVYELVVSLGMKATRTERMSRLGGVDHGTSHRVTFVPTRLVFRLPRKVARLRFDTAQADRRVRRYVVSVDAVPPVPMRCIAIDSPSRLYLAGRAMVPTHNTNLASVLVEEFALNGLRFSVIDPMGVWWGLRHDADGRGAGIEAVILGGIHGDLPIDPTSGADVADFVTDEDASVIIDISRRPDGSMWAIAERIRFVTAYAKRLYQRQGEKRRPIHQVIDEAARFAPQIVRAGEMEVAACMGAIAVLVEEGRNVGIGVSLVTQRSARLNKDVAELADCMIAFRIVGPNSMRAVLDWLGEHVDKARLKEIGEQIRSLPRGSALVVSPGWLEYEGIVAMRKRRTFDSSKTPESGKDVRASGPGAKPDLAKYRQRFAKAIEEARANDPKVLKARVAELEKQLVAKKPTAPAPTVVEKKVLTEEQLKRLERVMIDGGKAAMNAIAFAQQFGDDVEKFRETVRSLREPAAAATPTSRPAVAPRTVTQRPPAASPRDSSLGGGLLRIMTALAQRPDGLTNRQIGIRAGLSSKSGTFSTYLSRARSHGWIADHGDRRTITDAGLAALGDFEPLPTGAALAEHWLRELGGGEARILRVLLEAGCRVEVDAETIGERAQLSHKSGTYSTYVSRLRGLELVIGRGSLRASDELFDGGTP